jgi:hypothetical protein
MHKSKLITLFLLIISLQSYSQFFGLFGNKEKPKTSQLLLDRGVQIESTKAINNMYNFKFHEAEVEFKWMIVKFPEHPIGYFLLGLNEWWKIVPDTKNTQFDEQCHTYMDRAIDKADELLSNNGGDKEAAFFLACAYAFKGRLYAEREKWVKSAWAGKQAIKYLEKSRGSENINPELIFGDGLYNYYSKWIHENYKSLKPLLTFFRKGNKTLGIEQLEDVSLNAFYTRMEARYFLVQIYSMEHLPNKALMMSRQMHSLYPDNSFFHRYVARTAFSMGRLDDASIYAKQLLANIEAQKFGYSFNDGRYGAYILGYTNEHHYRDLAEAKVFYSKCIAYSRGNNSEDSGYFLGANLALGRISEAEGNSQTAMTYYEEVLKNAEKKSDYYIKAKQAVQLIKNKNKGKKK